MQYPKIIPPIVVYVLLVLAIWLLVIYVAKFSPTAAVWAIASIAAVEAIAVMVLVGFGALYMVSLIFRSVESVIQRMWPSQRYLQPENIFKLTGHIVVLLGITLVGLLIVAGFLFICPGGLGCSDWGAEAARLAERETMKTAIMSMMVDNDLSQVTASVSGHGGEKIRSTGTQFHPTLDLQIYMNQAATRFCYRWDADGRITFQYDVDDNVNCAIDAEQLFP